MSDVDEYELMRRNVKMLEHGRMQGLLVSKEHYQWLAMLVEELGQINADLTTVSAPTHQGGLELSTNGRLLALFTQLRAAVPGLRL